MEKSLARAYLEMGLANQAEAMARSVIGEAPGSSDAAAYEILARSLLLQSRGHEALAVAESALRISPDEPELQLVLAKAYRQIGLLEQADAALRKSLEFSRTGPISEESQVEMAAVLNEQGRFVQAEAVLRQTMAKADADSGTFSVGVRRQLALALTGQARLEEARMLLEALVGSPDANSHDGSTVADRLLLAQVCRQLGDLEQARRILDEQLALMDGSVAVDEVARLRMKQELV